MDVTDVHKTGNYIMLDTTRARQYLKSFDFEALFIEELGWDHYTTHLSVMVDDQTYALAPVAQKRGFVVVVCDPQADGRIPDYALRCKIERQVANSVHEHLIVYMDGNKTSQIWQWVKREIGRPIARREHKLTKRAIITVMYNTPAIASMFASIRAQADTGRI